MTHENYSVACLSFEHLDSTTMLAKKNSASQRKCLLKVQNRENEIIRFDNRVLIQQEHEVTYWRNVLKVTFLWVKILSSRGVDIVEIGPEVYGFRKMKITLLI